MDSLCLIVVIAELQISLSQWQLFVTITVKYKYLINFFNERKGYKRILALFVPTKYKKCSSENSYYYYYYYYMLEHKRIHIHMIRLIPILLRVF